jgi:two-component system response regulator (stage 0 sporulation protein A)
MLENKIVEILKELRIPMGNLGFKFIKKAVELIVADESKADYICKAGGLYEIIGNECDSSKTKVERAIRHGIITAFEKAEKEVLMKYFGHDSGGETNKNFIAYIVYEVKKA